MIKLKDNVGDFYLRRKCYLDNLKRKQSDNKVTNRTNNILSSDAVELFEYEVENRIDKNFYEYCNDFGERYSKFLEDLNETKKET